MLSGWPALVLAAGYGTRLRPLTDRLAKPALAVAGTPLIIRVLRWLGRWGVRDVVINLHYRPETITALVGDGQSLGLRVRYSWERSILGSAGGPARAFQLAEAERWLVVNADTLTDVDLAALTHRHMESPRLVTMALVPNPNPEHYGGVLLEDDRVTGFTARLQPRPTTARTEPIPSLHFIGVQAVEQAAFDGVAIDRRSDSVGELYPRLIASRPGSIRGFVSNAAFFDIGTPADLARTSAALQDRAEWP